MAAGGGGARTPRVGTVSVLRDEKTPGDVFNGAELCTYKWLKWSVFYYVYFTTIKNVNEHLLSTCSVLRHGDAGNTVLTNTVIIKKTHT